METGPGRTRARTKTRRVERERRRRRRRRRAGWWWWLLVHGVPARTSPPFRCLVVSAAAAAAAEGNGGRNKEGGGGGGRACAHIHACIRARVCVYYTGTRVWKPGSSFKLAAHPAPPPLLSLRRMNNGGGPGVKNPLFSLRRPLARAAGFFGSGGGGGGAELPHPATPGAAHSWPFPVVRPPRTRPPFLNRRNILKASLPSARDATLWGWGETRTVPPRRFPTTPPYELRP